MLAALCLFSTHSEAQQVSQLSVDDIEFEIERYPADGEFLLLWLAPEYGFRAAHREFAERLPAREIEVWLADIAEALFLPAGSATLRALDGTQVARLLVRAHRDSGKKVVLAGDSYASLAALAGARAWQEMPNTGNYLVGAILFTPNTYAAIPPLGISPRYMPIVDATNIPLLILQATGSAAMPRFDELLERLRVHGSPVYTRMMPGVMSLFYEEPPTEEMRRAAEPIPDTLRRMLPLLAHHEVPERQIALSSDAQTASGIDIYLKEFNADIRPASLSLDDIDGNRVIRENFAGKVTLVNFWATWCPPCVEEIPSLNRLQQTMAGRPFELISINYAEERERVAAFLERVEVEFPVLLDLDGRHAKAWNVTSYPSTFVIDRQGRIRYGVNAAIDWDDPELLSRLRALME